MASYKESSKTSTVGTDEPDPKVPKLTASTSSADEPDVQLEDHTALKIYMYPKLTSRAQKKGARPNAPVAHFFLVFFYPFCISQWLVSISSIVIA